MDKKILTPSDLAEMLGKTTASLAQWRYLGVGPKYIKAGRAVRYCESDISAWLEAQTRQQTGEQVPA